LSENCYLPGDWFFELEVIEKELSVSEHHKDIVLITTVVQKFQGSSNIEVSGRGAHRDIIFF